MGLRSASARRCSQVVMAPALTETTTQSQNFKLAPKDHFQLATPINNFELNNTTYRLGKGKQHDEFYENDENNGKKKKLNNGGVENGEKIVKTKKQNEVVECPEIIVKLASDNNFFDNNIMNIGSPSMGDQRDCDKIMGIQKMGLDSFNKEKNEVVETLLMNASSSSPGQGEIPPNVDDLMRAITSSMENERGPTSEEDFLPISAGDLTRDLATSLLSFEKQLLNDVDIMNMSMEDQQEPEETPESLKESKSKDLIAEAQKKQVEVQRRLDFLRRRVLKLQSRIMCQHAGEEIAGVFEHVHRSLKRLKESANAQENNAANSRDKPLSCGAAKSLAKKLDASKVSQANSAARQRQVPRYFGSGSIEPAAFRGGNVSGLVAIPPWTPEHKQELQRVSGALRSELRIVQSEVDSEATDSSSGGESCDEFQNYNNQHQQYLSIQKRSLWKYSTDRAAIAARWTWLQVQISDLEYRIRQHSELHRQTRANKGAVALEGADPPSRPVSPAALNGYRGQLPGGAAALGEEAGDDKTTPSSSSACYHDCARTRPLAGGFRKRKLLQTGGLHVISKRAARPANARCSCAPPAAHCALCTGRVDATRPRDPTETLGVREKVAAVDPGFHPVFSMQEDVSESVHLEAIMKMPEWQHRSARMKNFKGYAKGERLDKTLLDHRSKKLEHRKKYGRLLKPGTISALSAKIKNKIRGRKRGRHPGRSAGRRHASSSSRRLSSMEGGGADGVSMMDDDYYDELDHHHHHHGGRDSARSAGGSPASSPLLHMQSISGLGRKGSRVSSYDIDNIVIPYSVAASTRVEKLQYKEILTPKWRIAEDALEASKTDAKDSKNNGAIKETEEDNDFEDLSEEATSTRHDICEQEERKKFLSYLKFPLGHHANRPSAPAASSRSHKRTDSRAESSDTNTPDPLSPPLSTAAAEGAEPTAEALPGNEEATPAAKPSVDVVVVKEQPLPSISVMRRRQMSSGRTSKVGGNEEGGAVGGVANSEEPQQQCYQPEVQPYERRRFPLDEKECETMLREMPEDHKESRTNVHAQDTYRQQRAGSNDVEFEDEEVGGARGAPSYVDSKACSPGGSSESTESAPVDEDPNDPEWIDVEKTRERHHHHHHQHKR